MQVGSEGNPDASWNLNGGSSTNGTRPSGFVPPEPAELAKQFLQLDIIELLGQGAWELYARLDRGSSTAGSL
jgi:hypothetical protein